MAVLSSQGTLFKNYHFFLVHSFFLIAIAMAEVPTPTVSVVLAYGTKAYPFSHYPSSCIFSHVPYFLLAQVLILNCLVLLTQDPASIAL